MRRAARAALAVVAMSALALGCGSPAVDKQGARSHGKVVTLHLGAADPGEPSLAHFVDEVDRRSHGRLAVHVDRETYFSETPGGPAKLAGDLRSGKVDLALIPSRDWAATGDPGFAALQAPFLVTSTDATIELARSQLADDLLKGMAANDDVVGLGLVPGETRRLLTREPVVEEADLHGKAIRVSDSDQTTALLTALGARPVQGMLAAGVREGLKDGTLDGVEMAPIYLGQNGYNLAAPYLTSFALIPKFEVLAASSPSWHDLSGDDRRVLGDAGGDTVAWEARRLAGDEANELSLLCDNGLVVVQPTAASLDAWRRAAPVPEGAAARRVMADIATEVPHSATSDAASDLPEDCPVATSDAQARTLHQANQPVAEPSTATTSGPTDGPTIPPGTYEETVTAEQFAAAGLVGTDFAVDVTYTWVLRPDGTFLETQKPDYPDQGPQQGRYVVDGDQLLMTYGPDGLPPERAHWSFYHGTLTFTEIEVEDPGAGPLYETPWHKVD